MPRRKRWQVIYAVLAGVLFLPQFHIGAHYLSPELALVIANAAMIPARSLDKRWFELDRVLHLGPGLLDFVYRLPAPLAYQPGQYMEWTVDQGHADSRGKRRYFTLASSPTEKDLRIGVKFERDGSSFKEQFLAESTAGRPTLGAQVAGDFVLPRDQSRKLAFIGGGIGITPFRSMAKYLTDRREPRDVVLIYAAGSPTEFVYRDVFEAAWAALGMRTIYLLSSRQGIPPRWMGKTGRVTPRLIARQIPDYGDRLFYISGSSEMVKSTVGRLHELGISQPPDQDRLLFGAGILKNGGAGAGRARLSGPRTYPQRLASRYATAHTRHQCDIARPYRAARKDGFDGIQRQEARQADLLLPRATGRSSPRW